MALDGEEHLVPEQVGPDQIEDCEACIGETHVACVIVFACPIRPILAEVVLSQAVEFHDQWQLLVFEIASAQEVPGTVADSHLRNHSVDGEPVKLHCAERLSLRVVTRVGETYCLFGAFTASSAGAYLIEKL